MVSVATVSFVAASAGAASHPPTRNNIAHVEIANDRVVLQNGPKRTLAMGMFLPPLITNSTLFL
jgi:hypothetical protein